MARKCNATNKKGERCKKFALGGMLVCWSHRGRIGGDGKEKVAEKAEQRVSLAKFLRSDSRPLGVIITEAFDTVDSYARALREQAAEQDVVDPELAERMVAAAQTAATLGVGIGKLGLDERRVRIQEREQHLIVTALRAIMSDPRLALTPAQRQMWEQVVPEHLRDVVAKPEAITAVGVAP